MTSKRKLVTLSVVPLDPVPPEPSRQFVVAVRCCHCGAFSTYKEGDMPNQVEHFQMRHKGCPASDRPKGKGRKRKVRSTGN